MASFADPSMEFDHLKGFYYVAKLGSFTEAAGRLFISQPAMSQHVKALENELGERVFDRSGRKIRLTPTGEILFKEVEELIAKVNEIQQVVTQIKSLDCGRLAVGASDTMSIHYLPELLNAFRRQHPKVELCIVSLVSREVARKVKERQLDLGIITLPSPQPELDVIPAFEQRFVCIVQPQHHFEERSFVELREVAQEPLILLERASLIRQMIDEWLAAEGCRYQLAMELSNFEIIKRYVAAGLGVSLLPVGAVSPRRDGVAVVPLKQRLCLKTGIVLRRERRLSHAALAFLEMAKAYFRNAVSTSSKEASPTTI